MPRRTRPSPSYTRLQQAFARELNRPQPDWRLIEDLQRRLAEREARGCVPVVEPTVDEIGEE